MLGQIVDWFYGQIVGFLGNFFSEMGNMGAELFAMSWVQSVVLFFSYLGWALFAIGLVVACFECGVEYSGGRGNVKETALNAIKGFLAVSLFSQVPVRLYELAVSLQADLTAGITGFGTTSIGDAAKAALEGFNAVESLTSSGQIILRGFGPVTSGLMVIFCLALMAYAVIITCVLGLVRRQQGQHIRRKRYPAAGRLALGRLYDKPRVSFFIESLNLPFYLQKTRVDVNVRPPQRTQLSQTKATVQRQQNTKAGQIRLLQGARRRETENEGKPEDGYCRN